MCLGGCLDCLRVFRMGDAMWLLLFWGVLLLTLFLVESGHWWIAYLVLIVVLWRLFRVRRETEMQD